MKPSNRRGAFQWGLVGLFIAAFCIALSITPYFDKNREESPTDSKQRLMVREEITRAIGKDNPNNDDAVRLVDELTYRLPAEDRKLVGAAYRKKIRELLHREGVSYSGDFSTFPVSTTIRDSIQAAARRYTIDQVLSRDPKFQQAVKNELRKRNYSGDFSITIY